MMDTEHEAKLDELDRLLNDPDVPMEPARIWSLLAEIARRDVGRARRNRRVSFTVLFGAGFVPDRLKFSPSNDREARISRAVQRTSGPSVLIPKFLSTSLLDVDGSLAEALD